MKLFLIVLIALACSFKLFAQATAPSPDIIDNQQTHISFMYDNRVGDSYSLGLVFKPIETPWSISGIFFEGSYGGLFGKKEYRDLLEWAWENTFSGFNSRYNKSVSPKVDVEQRNWSLAIGLMPDAVDNLYFGLGATSVRLNQVVKAYSDVEVWARSINTSFDVMGGLKFATGVIVIDLRVGYPLFKMARQNPGDTRFIRDYYGMSSEEYSWFSQMWDAAIRENAIDFLKEGVFFGFSIGINY